MAVFRLLTPPAGPATTRHPGCPVPIVSQEEPRLLDAPTVQVSVSPTLPCASLIVPIDGLSFQALERALIGFALQRYEGNQTRAARFLHLSRSALLYRMRKYRLHVPPVRPDAPGVKD